LSTEASLEGSRTHGRELELLAGVHAGWRGRVLPSAPRGEELERPIESEDPARVWAAVRQMGLARFENLSYPRGLKRLLALPA